MRTEGCRPSAGSLSSRATGTSAITRTPWQRLSVPTAVRVHLEQGRSHTHGLTPLREQIPPPQPLRRSRTRLPPKVSGAQIRQFCLNLAVRRTSRVTSRSAFLIGSAWKTHVFCNLHVD